MISWLSSTHAKYFLILVLFYMIVTGFLFLLSSHSSPSQQPGWDACWLTWTENKSRGRTLNYKFLYILFLVLSISLIVMYTSSSHQAGMLGMLGVNNATIEGWYSNNTVILICNKILKFSFWLLCQLARNLFLS